MHVVKLLHKTLGNSCQNIDKRVIRILFEATETLTRTRMLSIFGLGRSLQRSAKVKHTIKCIDRLFGNKSLHQRRTTVYRAINNLLLANNQRPIISVDWSGITKCGEYHFLRAAVAVGGRTLTIYEQVYHIREYANYNTHRQFILALREMLPANCRPIIVTDAGFRNNWFKLVLSIGWDFVGRIRHNTQYCSIENNKWLSIKSLYSEATTSPKFLGKMQLSKSTPLLCYFYQTRQRKKYRERRNLAGKKIRCSVSLKHGKRGNEPWLIASSLTPDLKTAEQIMSIYKKRMQIEESFRDLKNTRNGFSLRHYNSLNKDRLHVALLIAALATFVLWLLGVAAKRKKLHYSFQANTERKRNVLSNFIIGWQVLERRLSFTKTELQQALEEIVLCAAS